MYRNNYDLSEEQNALIARFQLQAPVDVEGLARELQIRIERSTDIDTDGDLCKHLDGTFTIRVNGKQPADRQRFTIAHELGHYFLHRQELAMGGCFDRGAHTSLQDYKEIEANRAAADILLPLDLIDKLVSRPDISTISDLAAALEVSEQALRIRLNF